MAEPTNLSPQLPKAQPSEPPNGNIQVGTVFGIPFFLNPSWFFVFVLVTVFYAQALGVNLQLTGLAPWLLGAIAALLLFGSVLAHELGHSLVAQRQGIGVKSITLFIFGGLARLDREAETPAGAFWIAIAGPVVSLILCGIFLVAGVNLPLPEALVDICALLTSINFFLAAFNLIPGLPLDGGNILKAIVWKITGNANKGVIIAGRVGQGFGYGAIALGIFGTLGILPLGNLWTLLIGWFLLQNAGVAAQSARIQDTLDHLTAQDAIIPHSPLVAADLDLRSFTNQYVIGKPQWKKFLVTDGQGQLLGAIATEDLKTVPTSQWPQTPLRELIQPIAGELVISAQTSLLDIVKRIETGENREFTVVGTDNQALGLIDKTSIIDLLQKQKQDS